MANSFGGTVKLTGESEYTKALKTITSNLTVMASEMKVVSSQYSANDKSVQAITSRNAILNKQIEEGNKKINTYRKALEDFNKQQDANASSMMQMMMNLEQEKKKLEDLKNSTTATSKEIKDQEKKVSELSSQLASCESQYDKNKLSINKYQKEMNLAQAEVNNLSNELEKNEEALENNKNAYDTLSDTISEQKTKLDELKSRYASVVLEQGKSSKEAKSLKSEIKTLSGNIAESEDKLKKSTTAIDKFTSAEKEAGTQSLKLGDLIKANLISEAIIGGVKALGGALVDATKKMASFINEGVQNASNLQEVQNVVDTTFGDSASVIDEWSKKASTSFGMSELSAKKYNGTMGAMLKSMKLSDDEIIKMSTDMVGLAGDFASFYNLDSEEAFNKIRAGISGETEPLKQLGINMSVANLEAYAMSQGIDKAYNSMTQAEQATLRYNYLMSVTADAQGDFAKTSDSFANQQRIAQLQLENLATSIGSFLLPSINEAMIVFNDVLSGELTFEEGITRMTEMIMGLANKIIEKLPELLNAGMSMLQTIVSGIQTALPQIIPIVLQIVNTLLTTIIQMLPQILQMGITIIVELANGLAQQLPTLIPIIIEAIMSLVETIIDNLDQIIDAGINIVLALADGLIEALPKLIEKIPVIITKLINAIVNNLPKLIEMGITLIVKLGVGLIKAIPQLVAQIPQIIKALVDGLGKGISNMASVGKNLVQGLWNGINNAKDWVLDKIKGFGKSVLNGIKSFFGIKSPSKLFEDQIGKNLALGIGVGFTDEMDNVATDIENAIPTDFDFGLNTNINPAGSIDTNFSKEMLVDAFKEALSGMTFKAFDETFGELVVDNVEKVVYS